MKRTIGNILLVFILLFLSSCEKADSNYSIRRAALTEDEYSMMKITSDFHYVFELQSGNMYDLKIRYYEKGVEKDIVGEIKNIDTADKNIRIIVHGKKDFEQNITWNVLSDMTTIAFPSVKSDITDAYGLCYNSIEALNIEKQQEYVLGYAIYTQNTNISVGKVDDILSSHEFGSELDALIDFDCVFIVTIECV